MAINDAMRGNRGNLYSLGRRNSSIELFTIYAVFLRCVDCFGLRCPMA